MSKILAGFHINPVAPCSNRECDVRTDKPVYVKGLPYCATCASKIRNK